MQSRRGFLALGLSAVVGSAGCLSSGDTGTDDEEPQVGLETVTDAPTAPLAFRETQDGQAYVADRPGRVHLLGDGTAETALDMTDAVMTGSERGLLGLALHPEFGSTGRLYIRYSSPPRPGTPQSYSHTFVLAEFETRADGSINPDSERPLLEIPQPQSNHNSGPIRFGPDGYLYVGVGDGGAGGDVGTGHVPDWYEPNEGGNGQDVTENLLGSLLRIDVDAGGDQPYGIPGDNPMVGRAGLDEHYAWGLRNPWGISFDGEDCYVADVGQNRFEEVNRVETGGNYGWNVTEGTHCFETDDCPETTSDGEQLSEPVIEYPHSGAAVSGVAVVGGHVYHGDGVPALDGRYVFGDLNAEGELFVADPADEGLWSTAVLPVESKDGDQLGRLLGLSRDRAGEQYALTDSGVHRIVSAS